MPPRPHRVFDLVRECQRFAGDSSLATARRAQASLVREFVSRLPDATCLKEEIDFRRILLEVALAWSTQVHHQFHKSDRESCRFAPTEDVWPFWRVQTRSAKATFHDWAEAFLTSFDRAHPLSGAARAREIIDVRYDEQLGVETLARMIGCHSVRLQASFKREFGVSVREYRTRVRVLRAAELTATSEAKIDAIAATVGFRSRRLFYKAFRRVVGCTPSEMRACAAGKLEQIVEGGIGAHIPTRIRFDETTADTQIVSLPSGNRRRS